MTNELKYKFWFLDRGGSLSNAPQTYSRFCYRHYMNALHRRLKTGVKQTLIVRPDEGETSLYYDMFEVSRLPQTERDDSKVYLKRMFKRLPSKFGKDGVELSDAEAKQLEDEMRKEFFNNRNTGYDLIDYTISPGATSSKTMAFRKFKQFEFRLVDRMDNLSIHDYNMFKCVAYNIIEFFRPFINMKLVVGPEVAFNESIPEDKAGDTRYIRVLYGPCKGGPVGVTRTWFLSPGKITREVTKTDVTLCEIAKYATTSIYDDVYSIHQTLIHEMLHAFGMDHNPNNLSYMIPALNIWGDNGIVVDPLKMPPCDYQSLVAVYGCPPVKPQNVARFDGSLSVEEVKRKLNDKYYRAMANVQRVPAAATTTKAGKRNKRSTANIGTGVNRFYNNLRHIFEPSDSTVSPANSHTSTPILFYIRNFNISQIATEVRLVGALLPSDFLYCFVFVYDQKLNSREEDMLDTQIRDLENAKDGEEKNNDNDSDTSASEYNCLLNCTNDDGYVSLMVLPGKIVGDQETRAASGAIIIGNIYGMGDANDEYLQISHLDPKHMQKLIRYNKTTDQTSNNYIVSLVAAEEEYDDLNDELPGLVKNTLPISGNHIFTSPNLHTTKYPFNNLDGLTLFVKG